MSINNIKPHFYVLYGDGINCELETKHALESAGAIVSLKTIQDLVESKNWTKKVQGFVMPGGFSFGDDLGSGQILALKLELLLQDSIREFVVQKKALLGICNGFQALVKMGLLPDHQTQSNKILTLTHNIQKQFVDKCVDIQVSETSDSPWIWQLKSKKVFWPVRHGEGAIVISENVSANNIYNALKLNGQIPLQYTKDINGSYERIAALCDPSGLVFGLMPHPEAALYENLSPVFKRFDKLTYGSGYLFFRSIVEYFNK